MPVADVTLISTYPPRGVRHGGTSGVASYTSNLAHGLAGQGARVAVIAPEQPGEPACSLDGRVRVERRYLRGPTALAAAARAAADTGAPVVHLQHEVFLFGGTSAVPGLVPALRRLRQSAGLVVTLHQVVDPAGVDSDFTRLHRVRVPASLARTALRTLQTTVRHMAHRVIVHEPGFARVVDGAAVIPHGVEHAPTPDRHAARRRLGLGDDRLNVLCFGFVAPYKGLEAALEAASLVGDRARLVVAGGDHPRLSGRDPYAARLRRRWGDTARFVGYVPEDDDPDSSFSNLNRGAYDRAYHYDNQASFDYLATRGVELVRIPFRWERVQPTLGAELDLEEVRRLKAVVGRAGAAGMKMVLDLHNYGAYYLHDPARRLGVRQPIGSAAVPVPRFADLWRRLSGYFKGNPAVLGYGLMNEPVGMPDGAKGWERASQAALDRIRANGDGAVVLVAGYYWSGVQRFASMHPKKWIVDYSKRTLYEAHHYWDRDNSGDYPDSYDAEVADAVARGYRPSTG